MTLRKILSLLILMSIPLGFMVAQDSNRILTNTDIINMAKSGIGEQTIILTIEKATTKFDTTPEALIRLKTAGVSDAVLNAMLGASPAPTAARTEPVQQDCSPTLDEVLGTVGTPANIAAVRSVRIAWKSVLNRPTGSTTLQIDRVTEYPDRIYVAMQPSSGVGATIVITPDFNYMISGKMTTAVPAATLEDMTSSLKLEPIYIAQHRDQYSCVLEGAEQIGNINTAKLKIKGEGQEGELNVDPISGRLLRTTYPGIPSGQVMIDYSDWRQVGQIYGSFKRHVTNSGGTIDMAVSEYQVNPPTDAKLFQAPAGQTSPAVTLKVLQAESVPYTVQTNGGINTSCNINGSINTTGTISTYGNTTYGTATSTPNLQMNCRSTDTTVRWTHVLNAMLVQASDGNAYIIACDRAWRWSKCTPLKAGDTFLAKRGDKGFIVQSINSKSKEQEATYSVLQSKSLHD
jgi:hypothetical protein